MRCNTTMVLCVTYTFLILSVTLITNSLPLSPSSGNRHIPSLPVKVSLQQPRSDTHSDSPQSRPKKLHPQYTQGPKPSGQDINNVIYSVPLSISQINKWKGTAQGREIDVQISEESKELLANHYVGEEETERVAQSSSNTLSYDSSHKLIQASRKPSLPDLQVSLTSALVNTPVDISRTPSHTTPASIYSSPTYPSPLYTHAFTLLSETKKHYTSLSRRGQPMQVVNSSNNYLYTNAYHTPTEEIPEEIHFFWTWQAALIVGLAGMWLLAFSTLACLFRTSIGKSLTGSLCPSLLPTDKEEEEANNPQTYFILVEGSPGMRRPSHDERFVNSEDIETLIQDNDKAIWIEEDTSTNTSNTVNYLDNEDFEILLHRVIEIPKIHRRKFFSEGDVYPALRTSMKKMEDTSLSGSTSVKVTGSGAPVTLLRSSDIDIPFPCAIDPYVSVSESQGRFPNSLKIERKLSLIVEENIDYNVE